MAISKWPHRVRYGHGSRSELDYRLDWSDWLASGESIVTSDWQVTGATELDADADGTSTTVWLTAPTGTSITAVNTITTDSAPVARVDQRTLIIAVADR